MTFNMEMCKCRLLLTVKLHLCMYVCIYVLSEELNLCTHACTDMQTCVQEELIRTV